MGVFLSVCQEWLLEIEWLWSFRAESKERKDKESKVHGIWQCEPSPWSRLICVLQMLKTKALGHVFRSTAYTFRSTPCWCFSDWIYYLSNILMNDTNNLWMWKKFWMPKPSSFSPKSIPIKTWDNHNSESVLVIRLGHVRNFSLWKVFQLWTEPTCMSSVKAYFSFQLPLFSFSLRLFLSLPHPQILLPHLITPKMLTNNYDFRWCHAQRLVGWILTEKVASTKPHSKGSTTNFHSKVQTASTT